MLSGGLHADPGMLGNNSTMLIRGARATPDSNLGLFKNVGGMKRESPVWPSFPFLLRAWEILEEDPIDPAKLTEPPVAQLRNSLRWSDHLKQLSEFNMIDKLKTEVAPVGGDGVHSEVEGAGLSKDEEELASRICGKYTAVWKDVDENPPIARAIFDLRRLNAVCNEKTVKFTVLCAAQMIEEMRVVPTENGMFTIVHADLANFYYQIGVGPHLAKRMLLMWGKGFVKSKVMCMGFKKACGIAMAICMGLILRADPNEPDLGVLPEYLTGDTAPGCVRLKNGGVIFLVYDSIMIICPKKDADRWFARLTRNFADVRLVFKYCTIAKPGEIVKYCGMEVLSDRSGLKWRLAETSLSTWRVLRHAPVRRSPRSLFRIVSYLRFAMSVMGEPRWKLGRVSKAQSRLGLVTNWDVECVQIEDLALAWRVFDDLLKDWNSPEGWRHRRSHVPKVDESKEPLCVVIAVDATPFTWAVDVISALGVVQGACRKGKFCVEKDIAESESIAATEGLATATAFSAPVVILCGDNRGVGRGVWKGWSPNDDLDSWMLCCTSLLSLAGKCYVGIDIPTDENYADIATRERKAYSEEEIAFRLRRTFERAMAAVPIWKKTGQSYFGRESIIFNDEIDQELENYESDQE